MYDFTFTLTNKPTSRPIGNNKLYHHALWETLNDQTLEYLTHDTENITALYNSKLWIIPRCLVNSTFSFNFTFDLSMTDRFELEQQCLELLNKGLSLTTSEHLLWYNMATESYNLLLYNLVDIMSTAEISLFELGSKLNMYKCFRHKPYNWTQKEQKLIIKLYLKRLCVHYNLNIPVKFTGIGYELGIPEPVKPISFDYQWYNNIKLGDKVKVIRHLKGMYWNGDMEKHLLGQIVEVNHKMSSSIQVFTKDFYSYVLHCMEVGPI